MNSWQYRRLGFVVVSLKCPPDPPAGSPAVYPGIGTATVTWRSPPYDGGCMVTGYSVEMRRSNETSWTVVAEACHSLSHTVNDLEPEEVYLFRVRAENIHGASEPGLETRPVTIAEDEQQFKPAFEAREVTIEDGQLFKERYEVLEELGKGRYGIVRKVLEKSTGQHLAAKFIRTIKSKDKEQVNEEIRIMNLLRHPKLLQLAAAFESPREVVMIVEYISGGELFERVVADDFTLTERDSILFMRQICEGVQYMHENNVVHLDLKPENIMCYTRTSHQIKLIDFGLAQMLKPDTPIRVLFGTPEFIPPEIINYEPIGTMTDMWSVGVICYVLLTGLSPFMGENDAETFANITRADYDFEDEAFDAISQDAKDFISSLLEKRKELRMSAKQCLEHPWVAQHRESMSVVALPTDKLKKFIIRRKWQKTGNAIRALGRMATLSANSRRNSSTNESSPTRSLSPLVSLEEDVLSSPKIVTQEALPEPVEPTPDLDVEEIEKDSVVVDKPEEDVKPEENEDDKTIKVQDSKKPSQRMSSDDSCLPTEKLDNLGAKDPRLGKSSELIIEDVAKRGSTDYLGVNIEFCNLSKSEPEDIYLSNNNVVEVSNSLNEADPEETYPSSVVEPEDDLSSSRRSTTELVHSTVIEDVCLNGFKDFNLKRTRACSERSDSGISDCSSAALYSQGGELSSLIIAEEDEDSHGSSFGTKLRSSIKKTTSSTRYEISKTISTNGTNLAQLDYLLQEPAGGVSKRKESTPYYDEFSRPKASHGSNHGSTINSLKSTYDDPAVCTTSGSKRRLSTGLRIPREILRSRFQRSKSVFDLRKTEIHSTSQPQSPPVKDSAEEDRSSICGSKTILTSGSLPQPLDSFPNTTRTLATNEKTNTTTVASNSNRYFLALLAPDEDQDSGLIRGPPRVNTGSVSRTARMFEREELPPTKEIPTSLPRVTPSVPGKPHNDRIQKAFAFWNK